MFMCMYVCVYVCMYVRTYVCMYVHERVYIYTHICMLYMLAREAHQSVKCPSGDRRAPTVQIRAKVMMANRAQCLLLLCSQGREFLAWGFGIGWGLVAYSRTGH